MNTTASISRVAILEPLDNAGDRVLVSRSDGIYQCPRCNGTEDILSIKMEMGNNTLLWCPCGTVSLNGVLLQNKTDQYKQGIYYGYQSSGVTI